VCGFAFGVSGCAEERPRRPDIALIIADTLRADALGAWGNPRPTSPHLDRLAEGAVVFERVLAAAPNTATSHATLFTGLDPWVHRVANITSLEHGTPGLDGRFSTLAERFAAAGYQTAAFTDDGPLGRGWNLMQGFATLDAKLEGVAKKVDRALEWLRSDAVSAPDAAPFFILLHTYQTHQPFAPPEVFVERFDPGYDGVLRARVAEVRALRERGQGVNDGLMLLAGLASFTERDHTHLRALYDAEVAYLDAELARLWQGLVDLQNFDAMAIAFTSDHGEEFGEHGRWGHVQLHDETLHVPLILKLPHAAHAGRRVAQRVGLVDLHPTLLELGDVAPAAGSRAISLLGPLATGNWADRPVLAQTTEHLYAPLRSKPALASMRQGHFALLVSRASRADAPGSGPPVAALYDIQKDPGEHAPMASRDASGAVQTLDADGSDAAAKLATLLARLQADLVALERTHADLLGGGARMLPGSAELERLHGALGYR